MKRKLTILISFACIVAACHKAATFDESNYDERLSGGAATVFDQSSRAFTNAMPGLSEFEEHLHELGDAAFEQTFVAAPAPVNNGLGPVYNNVSCISCHHNDGKGTPTAGYNNSSLLFRISIPGVDDHGGPAAIGGYGGQLQDRGTFGHAAEGKVDISYTDLMVTYPDGNTVTLRQPAYTLHDTYTGVPASCLMSPRLAPPVFGLGLLELVPESEMQAIADQQAAEGKGISGRINYGYNVMSGKAEPGRFGLKATVPTILQQVAGAYNQDMGITNKVFNTESCWDQPQYDGLSDDAELPDSLLNAVTFYVKTLAVPARRDVADPTVRQGQMLFAQTGCASCHQPTLQTDVDVRFPALSNQRIHPYTDLLIHDMGAGLADGRPDFMASGTEWRTATLWGIGLFGLTNGVPYYLHDGRARSIEEAILWHGGEAEGVKQAFMNLSALEREAVIRFLQSL